MVARVRAELGFMVHDMIGITPHTMIINGFGTRRLGKGTLTIFALYHFFTRTNWTNPMPEPLEAFKISSLRNISPRNMAVAILLATVIGSAVTFWLLLEIYYRHGAASGYFWPSTLGFGRHAYGVLENWLSFSPRVRWARTCLYGCRTWGGGVVDGFAGALFMVVAPPTWLCDGK